MEPAVIGGCPAEPAPYLPTSRLMNEAGQSQAIIAAAGQFVSAKRHFIQYSF
jgi:hypothetical protein